MTKANTTDAHEEKGSALLSNKEEEKPLETTSQKEELPEVVPNTPQEGTHLPLSLIHISTNWKCPSNGIKEG